MNPVVVLFAASVLWGCTWWPLKKLAELGVAGLPQILAAYAAGALLLLPLLVMSRARWRADAKLMAGIFVLGGLANLAFAWALVHGEVVRVMVLFYLLPVWGTIGGRIFLGETIDAQRTLAVVLALAGAVLVLGGPGVLRATPSTIDLIAIASGLFFALSNICFRAAQHAPVTSKVAMVFLGCTVFALLLVVASAQAMPAGIAAMTWLLVIASGIMLLIATLASQYGVTHLEAGRSSVIIIVELLTAVITAAWWAGETMSGIEWAGGALILCAAVLEGWRPATSSSEQTA